MNPEKQYYETMNVVTAPVRFAIDIVKTVIILAIGAFIGLMYPFIQLYNGEPFTLASILVPVLTALAIFTFFYAPYYTLFGGITLLILVCANSDFVIAHMDASGDIFLLFAFLTLGIVQRYIRHRLCDPPKPPEHFKTKRELWNE